MYGTCLHLENTHMRLIAFVLTLIARLVLFFSKSPAKVLLSEGEKVWLHPSLIGYGTSRYFKVGEFVKDKKGRMCTVVKMGQQGALRLVTENDMMHEQLRKATSGTNPQFQAMMWMLKFKLWKFRVKKSLTPGSMTWEGVAVWLFVVFPFTIGFAITIVGVLK